MSAPSSTSLKAPDPERVTRSVLALNLALATGLSLILLAGGRSARACSAPGAAHAPADRGAVQPDRRLHRLAGGPDPAGKGLRAYYAVTASAELIAAACAIALLFLGFGVYALIAQLYCRAALLLLGYLVLQRPPLGAPLTLATMRELASWSSHRYAGVFTGFFSNYGADFIIGALLSPAATGLFRAGSRIVTAVSDIFSQPITMIATTAYSRRAATGRDFLDPLAATFPGHRGGGLAGPGGAWRCWATTSCPSPWARPGPGPGRWSPCSAVARGVGFIGAVVGSYLVVKNFQRALSGIQLFGACGSAAALAVFAALRPGRRGPRRWPACRCCPACPC